MTPQKQRSLLSITVGAVVALTIGVGAAAWLSIDPSGERGSGLPLSCDYNLDKYEKIEPAMIHYRQKAEFPVAMEEVRGIAVGAEDRILVAGDKAIHLFAPDGKKLKEIVLDQAPYCLTVGGAQHASPGRLYVGMKDHVEVYDDQGKRQAAWTPVGPRARLTSIAPTEEEVFVADAGSLVVWHYDLNGKLLGSIGKRDRSQESSGFVCPSPYFDLAMAPDGLLRIANPGRLRVDVYTVDGHHELSWGKSGVAIGDFCGCCGPSNIAILPDGRVVTAEKGIPRVKVYSASGEFECVVAGPEILAPNLKAAIETCDEHERHPADLAVDSHSRIVVLDPAAKCVRVFEHK
jgi:hypothetical protein